MATQDITDGSRGNDGPSIASILERLEKVEKFEREHGSRVMSLQQFMVEQRARDLEQDVRFQQFTEQLERHESQQNDLLQNLAQRAKAQEDINQRIGGAIEDYFKKNDEALRTRVQEMQKGFANEYYKEKQMIEESQVTLIGSLHEEFQGIREELDVLKERQQWKPRGTATSERVYHNQRPGDDAKTLERMSKLIKPFNGDISTRTIQRWIGDLEDLYSMFDINKDDKVRFVRYLLSGDARDFYDNINGDEKESWSTFRASLEKHYTIPGDSAQALRNLHSIQEKNYESYTAFVTAFRKMVSTAKITDDQLITTFFVNALRDDDCRHYFKITTLEDTPTLSKLVQRVSNFYESKRPGSAILTGSSLHAMSKGISAGTTIDTGSAISSVTPSSVGPSASAVGNTPMQLDSMQDSRLYQMLLSIQTQMNTNPRKETRSCFRCGRVGHLVADCRAKTHVNGGPPEERVGRIPSKRSPSQGSNHSRSSDKGGRQK